MQTLTQTVQVYDDETQTTAQSHLVTVTVTAPDDFAGQMSRSLAQQLATLRSAAAQADAASQQTGALTLAQVTTQLRQTQAGLAAVTLAALRLARLVAGQLDGID